MPYTVVIPDCEVYDPRDFYRNLCVDKIYTLPRLEEFTLDNITKAMNDYTKNLPTVFIAHRVGCIYLRYYLTKY